MEQSRSLWTCGQPDGPVRSIRYALEHAIFASLTRGKALATPDAPGPVYDNSLRLLARREASLLCGWLGLPVTGAPVPLAESLPSAPRQLDLLTETAPNVLTHIEFESSPRTDLAHRMLEYRAGIMRRHPRHRITQHVIVLAHGIAPEKLNDPPELHYLINVTYLRDADPEPLLTGPGLAPLAVLARATDTTQRIAHLRRALLQITNVDDPGRRHDLLHATAVLAGIHLAPTTIETLTQEAGMPFTLDENTVAGRIIAAKAEARGQARGQAHERTNTLATLMRRTYGNDPRIPTLAQHLAELPREHALDLALTTTSLDHLAAQLDHELGPRADSET